MNPDLFLNKNIIVQGITGTHGSFHTKAMINAGVKIIAGTSPNKAGEIIHDVPVFGSISAIKETLDINISIIFVPAPFAKDAIIEAIDNSIPLIICITEGIPVHDMLFITDKLRHSSSVLLGPNSPGVLIPGVLKAGIIPAELGLPGSVAIVSRSGTLTYEIAASLTSEGIGQKYIIGIGGDQIKGMGFIDCLTLFENDPTVSSIIMIGEIGGVEEIEAAEYIKNYVTKPIFGYIAGHYAPAGKQLGHAGAILGSDKESALEKTKALRNSGVTCEDTIISLVETVVRHLKI